jgi:hypothetical protein
LSLALGLSRVKRPRPARVVRRAGTYYYTTDGKFAGTVHIAGLFRSVTVTARTHTIRLGNRVKLFGRLTLGNQGTPFCAPDGGEDGRDVMRVLARHDRSQPFKRIAMFPIGGPPQSKKAVDNRCTYTWQRKVRPGQPTTYIAGTFGRLHVFKRATSRPFTVRVRP